MPRLLLLPALLGIVCAKWDNTNFFDWFLDELNETENAPLVFEGEVPSYLYGGTFVQTGPARFSFGKYKFTHMLDGYSKANKVQFGKDGKATYTTKFLRSQFYNNSVQVGHIARGMFVGDIEPPPHWGPTHVLGPNDNNYIKMRRIGDQNMILADVLIGTEIQDDCVSFDQNVRDKLMGVIVPGVKWDDTITPGGDLCMLGTMAHAAEDKNGVFTGAMGCTGLAGNYHMVFNIEPSAPRTRKLLAKIPIPKGRGPSYMHSLAATPNYITLIAEPLYMNMVAVLAGESLGKGGLVTNADATLFQVVNRKTGAVRVLEAPGFIYGHVLNSYEDGEDIVMDLTWYEANNATTLGWMNRWFLEYMGNKEIRENWPRSQVVRYRLKANNEVEKTILFAEEEGQNDFETPKINENFDGQKYCISYHIHFHTYEYDEGPSHLKSGPFGAVGLAKRNICNGEKGGFYEPNTYPSEVQFVPNPAGTAEDDGVLLSMVFDGNTNSSFFQVLNAQTMKRIAKTTLPIKTPFLIHASWFPEKQGALEINI